MNILPQYSPLDPDPHPALSSRKGMIAYVRVSTLKQGAEGISLEGQRDMIHAYASAKRHVIVRTYEDRCSGRGRLSDRGNLREAVEHARRDGLPLVVASLDRLSRDVAILEDLQDAGISIHSADQGRIEKAALRAIILRAENERKDIIRLNRRSAQARKARGEKVGNLGNFRGLQGEGTRHNVARRDKNVAEIADFLAANPSLLALTLPAIVSALNKAGVLNLTSAVRGARVPWTVGSLRRKLKLAKAELESRSAGPAPPRQHPTGPASQTPP